MELGFFPVDNLLVHVNELLAVSVGVEVVAVGTAEFFDGLFDEGMDVFVACVASGVG